MPESWWGKILFQLAMLIVLASITSPAWIRFVWPLPPAEPQFIQAGFGSGYASVYVRNPDVQGTPIPRVCAKAKWTRLEGENKDKFEETDESCLYDLKPAETRELIMVMDCDTNQGAGCDPLACYIPSETKRCCEEIERVK